MKKQGKLGRVQPVALQDTVENPRSRPRKIPLCDRLPFHRDQVPKRVGAIILANAILAPLSSPRGSAPINLASVVHLRLHGPMGVLAVGADGKVRYPGT
jgi:hypothetical protein